MEELKEFLLSKGFVYEDCMRDDNGELSHLYFSKKVEELDFIYMLVTPHKGTDYRYMLRADAVDNHDRWANCQFEKFYKDEEDFKLNWNKYLYED